MIVLNLVLIGLVITLEPLPLARSSLFSRSRAVCRKGAAFIFGWLLSLAIVIAFTVLVTGNKPPKPNTAPSLAALAATGRRRRPDRDRDPAVQEDGQAETAEKAP